MGRRTDSGAWRGAVVPSAIALSLAAAIATAFCLAPTEQSMGDVQRIVYVHVPVAWLGLCGMIAAAVSGGAYLWRRDARWDHAAQAAAEVGWLCCTLTLVTGSLWAREAWGTWWEWDPRLTTAFVLWLVYSGVLLARAGIADRHRRARVGAVLSILGTLDIPLVVMATRWFRGLHPVSPEMDPTMRAALLIGVLAWSALFVWLANVRREQLNLERIVSGLDR